MAVDLTSIFRKINQRRATGGYVPQGFAEDVLKANLGAEIARGQTEEQIAAQKARDAEQIRQFNVNKTFQEEQAAKAAAARASEFATTTQLTNEQRDASKTQGLTSSLVQLPVAYMGAKQIYGDLFGKTPVKDAAAPATMPPVQNTPAVADPNVLNAYSGPPPQSANADVTPAIDVAAPGESYGSIQAAPAAAEAGTQLTSTGAQTLEGMNAPGASTGATTWGGSSAGAAGASTSAATLPIIGAAIAGASLTKENAKPSMDAGGPEGYLANSAQHPFAAVADPFTTSNDLFGTGQSPVAKSEEWITSKLGTVICTELHRQGLLSDELYKYDSEYVVAPSVYAGYRFLADPVVKLMQKSPVFTRLIAPLAVRTAREMAHRVNGSMRGSLIGWAILLVGQPVCGFVGRRHGGFRDVFYPVIP